MPPLPILNDPTHDEILERQLEKLFSDVVLQGHQAVAVAEPISTGERRFAPTAPPRRASQPRSRRLPRFLGLAAVAIAALAVLTQAANLLGSKQVEIQPAIAQAAIGDTSSSVNTIEPLPTATRDTSAQAVSPSPSPRSAIPTAPPTETPTGTPTPTATPTATPIASAQPVYTATLTPVPAYAIGLEAIPTPVPLVRMPDNAINIVLMGSDQRPYETQWRTDVIIIVSINPDLPSVSMLSIPRDTWLYIPNWTYQRINLADVQGTLAGYPGGGPGLVKATIEYNLGVHIDYYARVNFAGLMRIVDALGGIDVMLDCPVEDGFPDDPITEDPSVVTQISYPDPGIYHVDGKHALWLARSRKTTSEFARSRRQHRILQAIWVKANELGFITRLPELWDELTSAVETDLSLDDVLWLASIGLQLEPSQIHSGFIDGRYLSAWTSPGGASVLLPHTEKILATLDPFFNPYPFKAPQGFNRVEVWNGSGHPGWGYLAADKLLRNGFEVTNVTEADEPYEHSVILDFTTSSKGSPLPLIQSLFDATVAKMAAETQDVPTAPYRVIVGADYQPCEWPTLAQWQPTPTPSAPTTDN